MNNELQPATQSPFDSIRQTKGSREFWSARNLQKLLGYTEWRNFEATIKKAISACRNVGQNPESHFGLLTSTSQSGKGRVQEITDYHLTRYACYLTAMNGDPDKPEIAQAQTYFAIKIYEAEQQSPKQQTSAAHMRELEERLLCPEQEMGDLKQVVQRPRLVRTKSVPASSDHASEQWLRLIRLAIASQQAHLSLPNGDYPGDNYGWKRTIQPALAENEGDRVILSGGGIKIGWISGHDIYLNPTAAYDAANAAGHTGNTLAIQEVTLRKHLEQDGLLASTDRRIKGGKEIKLYVVRKTVEGGRQAVLHLKKSTLFPDGNEEKRSSDTKGSSLTHGTPVHHEVSQVALDAPEDAGVPAESNGTPAEINPHFIFSRLQEGFLPSNG